MAFTFDIFESSFMIILYAVGTDLFNYFFIPVLSLCVLSAIIYLVRSLMRF